MMKAIGFLIPFLFVNVIRAQSTINIITNTHLERAMNFKQINDKINQLLQNQLYNKPRKIDQIDNNIFHTVGNVFLGVTFIECHVAQKEGNFKIRCDLEVKIGGANPIQFVIKKTGQRFEISGLVKFKVKVSLNGCASFDQIPNIISIKIEDWNTDYMHLIEIVPQGQTTSGLLQKAVRKISQLAEKEWAVNSFIKMKGDKIMKTKIQNIIQDSFAIVKLIPNFSGIQICFSKVEQSMVITGYSVYSLRIEIKSTKRRGLIDETSNDAEKARLKIFFVVFLLCLCYVMLCE